MSLLRSIPVIHAVAERCSEVGSGSAFPSRPLSDEDIRTVTVGLVIVVDVGEKLLSMLAIMVIDNVWLNAR
jgi:hypothetical protein